MIKNAIVAFVIFAFAVSFFINSSMAAVPSNYNSGILLGTNASISKIITMQSEKEIAIILKMQSPATNFNNQLLNVSVSADNVTFHRVDSVQAGTTTVKVLQYSDTNKGTTLAINPSIFPFLKVDFPKILNKNTAVTWSAVR